MIAVVAEFLTNESTRWNTDKGLSGSQTFTGVAVK